jgi:23S rRNA (adenine-N6)-dimethyltransferase
MPDQRAARPRRATAAGDGPRPRPAGATDGSRPRPAVPVSGRGLRRRVLSQNFLVDRRAIAGLVHGAGAGAGDLVVDVGAGNGLITEALRGQGARVLAVERDPALARRLRAKFSGDAEVTVIEGDVLTTPMPARPYQVVANIPFGITTKILRHLLSGSGSTLRRADVIVQAEVARKRGMRARGKRARGTLLNACWEPWFEFEVGQWLPRAVFRPQPRVDAAVLIVRRREHPLLDPALRPGYVEFVTGAFGNAHPTVASALAREMPLSAFLAAAAELGFGVGALPGELEAGQWTGLFVAARGARATRAARGPGARDGPADKG